MTTSIFWPYGFLYWMATNLVLCRADFEESSIVNGCNSSISNQTGLILLMNCEKAIVNLADLYHLSKSSRNLIEIRDSADVTLANDEKNIFTLDEMREVNLFIENVTSVRIHYKTFEQLVINAVFRNIKILTLEEKSFSSCWGTVWFFNSPTKSSIKSFSSSDLIVYKSESSFTIHTRPDVTPRQKLYQVYKILNKVNDLEITIYAVLALIGAVILTLISLTIVVARKFVPPLRHLENLPDVIRVPTSVPPRRNNPVTKVSRISRVVFQKRRANNKESNRLKPSNHQHCRPPLPPPRDI
uniref:Uncharacterized protein n=1 Tax=Daphnia galeata TaxID=27404 RepID=A0A8J2S8C0_9CRUS|nr:unnamed protein product [Daphnia galeata]